MNAGGPFQTYLDMQARLDLYSVSNAVLTAAQCQEVTKLADSDTWKIDGVNIKRGQDAVTCQYNPQCPGLWRH